MVSLLREMGQANNKVSCWNSFCRDAKRRQHLIFSQLATFVTVAHTDVALTRLGPKLAYSAEGLSLAECILNDDYIARANHIKE